MLRYTAHRNVRLEIRGFGKLMCALIYCLLILYFLKFCFTIFFGFASFPTLKCKSFELTLFVNIRCASVSILGPFINNLLQLLNIFCGC